MRGEIPTTNPGTFPFLTDLDSRAAIKGSRDPLGLVPLWSLFGRRVVGNLTTVTGSLRGFTTTLLGYHFASEVQEREGETALGLFMKFEQLAAYCRYLVRKDSGFRGIERVKKALGESDVVTLSARPEYQILGNQKIYGLWGLFSVPSRSSGLLERDEVLTLAAQEFVRKQYLTALSREGFREGREIVELLRQRQVKVHLGGKHSGLAKALARVLDPKVSAAEREFYREHLAFGGPQDSTEGRQRQLAGLLGLHSNGMAFDRHELRAVIKEAARLGKAGVPLASDLRRIDHLESVLVPADSLFGFLQARHGQTVRSVADKVAKEWGPLKSVDAGAFRELQSQVAAAFDEPSAGERWTRVAEGLAAGKYGDVFALLLDHNAFVMRSRNGSEPWVRVANGRLDVRFRDEAAELPGRRELPNLWRNNYFLNPLKEVVMTLGGA